MINSHKELISEIRDFATKFDFLEDFKYVKDADTLEQDMLNVKSRTLVIGVDSVAFDDENYNIDVTYKFMIAESVVNTDEAIIDAESVSMFCVSALGDYLNYIQDAPVDFSGVTFINDSDGESCFSTISGNFKFTIKRSASYWKKMEAYSTN